MAKSLTDIKRERLEEFDEKFQTLIQCSPLFKEEENIRNFISETIDLMNKHYIEVVEAVIGKNEPPVVSGRGYPTGQSLHALGSIVGRNKLREEQRLCAHTLLEISSKEDK